MLTFFIKYQEKVKKKAMECSPPVSLGVAEL
jgi:hypothetical protein